jgi:aminopeptidase YwaD
MDPLEVKLQQHLRHLCVEIGPRPSGSPGNARAAEYIEGVFRQAGLEVERLGYECPAWNEGNTWLECDGKTLPAAANAYSPPCDVTASTVALGTIAELEAAALEGRIGILYGDLTRSPLSPKSWFLKSERDAHIVQLLEDKKPAALITVQARAGDLERVIEDWEFAIPSASVNAQSGLALLQQNEPPLHLRIDSQRSTGYTNNIVAHKNGRRDRSARIVLCAHYDTKIDTPGASDNGGGVAALLALAQLLGTREHALGLEWIAFTGEESLPMGDAIYVQRYESQFAQIVTAINMDGVGQRLAANNITTIASAPHFHDHVAALVQCYRGVVWVDPWPESNHSSFTWRGVPAVALSSGGARLAHLRADTVEWVSPSKLAEVVRLVADIVKSLQDKSPPWTRPPGAS